MRFVKHMRFVRSNDNAACFYFGGGAMGIGVVRYDDTLKKWLSEVSWGYNDLRLADGVGRRTFLDAFKKMYAMAYEAMTW